MSAASSRASAWVGAALLLLVLALMSAGRVESNLTQRRKCGSCGWEGSVSKHKPKCPKCASSLG